MRILQDEMLFTFKIMKRKIDLGLQSRSTVVASGLYVLSLSEVLKLPPNLSHRKRGEDTVSPHFVHLKYSSRLARFSTGCIKQLHSSQKFILAGCKSVKIPLRAKITTPLPFRPRFLLLPLTFLVLFSPFSLLFLLRHQILFPNILVIWKFWNQCLHASNTHPKGTLKGTHFTLLKLRLFYARYQPQSKSHFQKFTKKQMEVQKQTSITTNL